MNEDEMIWSHFGRKTDGFFVEVGANHPTECSQTWHLEQKGWRGILAEPQAVFFEMLKAQRKNSIVWRAACGSPAQRGQALLHSPKGNPGVATLQKNVDDVDLSYDQVESVPILTLEEILASAGNPAIDLLSVDTEGTEIDVLRGLNLKVHRPKLILIEDKCNSLEKHRFLRDANYTLLNRTGLNNWYVPGETNQTPGLGRKLKFFRKMYLGLPFRKFQRYRQARRVRPQ